MGKNKLKKFAEIAALDCVYEYPRPRLLAEGFPFKGRWCKDIFGNSNPIVLELGCGKGEYTVALAKANPGKNFIGIDIKGARIWKGAKQIEEAGLENAKFLRTEIENIESFFGKNENGENEVDEIWITFPDPQMQKVRKRLTSSRFLELYQKFLKPGGIIHLKTDSPFLYEYTRRLVNLNNLEVKESTDDLYGSGLADPVKSIKTFYESQWLSRGKSIKLISFSLSKDPEACILNHSDNPDVTQNKTDSLLIEPESDDIPKDDYKAYPRHTPTEDFTI